MANESSKLYAARGKSLEAGKSKGDAPMDDQELDEKRHDRSYNPINDAEKGSVSEKLNQDAAKYRKGPGPL